MSGVTPQGFDVRTLDQILDGFQTAQLAQISANLDLQITNPLGVINGLFAAGLAEAWEAIGDVYDGTDRDQAADDQLTSIGLLIGVEREGPQATLVLACVVNIDSGFHADPGTMFAAIDGQLDVIFTNRFAVDNPGGVAANVNADFIAIDTGPQQCLAGTLTIISQALSGWNSITNPTDGIVGTDGEVDAPYRIRQEQELSAAGSSTADAIRADILRASQDGLFSSLVTSCTVIHNDGDVIDANGVPAHSVEVICLQPGFISDDDQALADLIAKSKGAGIGTWGGVTKTVTDDQGFDELIRFTRPEAIPIYVDITIVKDAEIFPLDGVTQIKETIADFGNKIGTGKEIFAKKTVEGQAFDVVGVDDVTTFKIDTVDPPVAAVNIVINIRQVATFSTDDIDVTVT